MFEQNHGLPSHLQRLVSSWERTVQINQFNPVKARHSTEIIIPRATNRRLKKLIEHVMLSAVSLSVDFALVQRDLIAAQEYNINRNIMLNTAQELYKQLDFNQFSAEDNLLLKELQEDLADTFGTEWRRPADVTRLSI